MPIITTFEDKLVSLVKQKQFHWFTTGVNLAGVPGPSGGSGAPIGGFTGQLIQTKVAYDTTEARTSYTPPSGMSLLDNLNHIRQDIFDIDGPKATVITHDCISEDLTSQISPGTTYFTVTNPINDDYCASVYINGLLQKPNNYTVTISGITLPSGLQSTDELVINYNTNATVQATAQITVLDEGGLISSGVQTVNFVGSGIVAEHTDLGEVTVTIDTISSLTIKENNDIISTEVIEMNFIGGLIVNSSEAGYVTVESPTSFDQYIEKATFNNKGDIIVASGNNSYAALSVGDNDQVLIADSSQPQGVKWGDVPASGGGGTDELVKVASGDPSAGYLYDKVVGDSAEVTVSLKATTIEIGLLGNLTKWDSLAMDNIPTDVSSEFQNLSLDGWWEEIDENTVLHTSSVIITGYRALIKHNTSAAWAGIVQEWDNDTEDGCIITTHVSSSYTQATTSGFYSGIAFWQDPYDSAGDLYTVSLLENSTDNTKISVDHWTSLTTLSGNIKTFDLGTVVTNAFIRIRYLNDLGGQKIAFEYSTDGIGWVHFHDIVVWPFTPTYYGLCTYGYDPTWRPGATFRFFEYTSGTAEGFVYTVTHGSRIKTFNED